MAGLTPWFGLAFFDFGDQLDAPLNVQKEIDRFLVIDKQLYGLYSIFGSGVISGWLVQDDGFTTEQGISIAISPGIGIIRYIAAETVFPATISALPPNSVLNIYAVLQGSTAQDREVEFIYSETPLNGDYLILLARVETGQNAISLIDNNYRQLIDFRAIIKEEIDAHKHRGTPSKIDLQDETKNQLPGAKIESVDAEKITSGVFDIDRVPILNHDDLQFNGQIPHVGLDSFVKTLTENNRQLLGEVSTVNLLKHILFMKYKYDTIDEHMINELAFVPGISSWDLIDLDATTAHVDLDEKCISGKPAASGEFVDISWNTQTAFTNAFRLTNVQVVNGEVFLERDDQSKEVIENFEVVAGDGSAITGFNKVAEVTVDDFNVTATSITSLHNEGLYGGKFSTNRKFRALFVKNFATPRDWTNFNELVLSAKTLISTHGAVYCYFINDDGTTDGKQSDTFLVLQQDEITVNSDPYSENFEQRHFSIVNEDRDKVKSLVIMTDDTSDTFTFYLDDIYVQNTSLFKQQGTVNLRFSSPSSLTFHSVFFDAVTPADTSIRVRARSASSPSLLTRAAYTLPIHSGDVVALPGSDAEIEVTLLTQDRAITPLLQSVRLRLLVESNNNGFDIRNAADWELGQTYNVDIVSTSGDLAKIQLSSPVNVGGMAYSYLQAIRESDDTGVAVTGFSGVLMPIAPNQALDWANNPARGFKQPVSLTRRYDKKYLVTDRNNDRVLLCDGTGELIKGFGSVTKSDTDFYPLCAVYNPNRGILSIAVSKKIDPTGADLTKMSLFLGTTELLFRSGEQIVETDTNQVLNIALSADKVATLRGFTGDIFVTFKKGSFPLDIATNDNAQKLIGMRGMSVFVGDFTYNNLIHRPVVAEILDNGDWIVGNSSIEYDVSGTSQSGLNLSATSISVQLNAQSNITISGGTPPYSILSAPSASIATATINGTTLTINALSSTGSTAVVIRDSDPTGYATATLAIRVANALTSQNTSAQINYPSVVQFNPETLETTFTTGLVLFSDFTLGGFSEISDERIAVAGIFRDTGAVVATGQSDQTTYSAAAIKALSGYRGIVAVIDKPSLNMVFRYVSPDGLYASDVDIDENGNFVVAESAFAAPSGRVIVLDNFGNIIRMFGNKLFNVVNDARAAGNGHILISV